MIIFFLLDAGKEIFCARKTLKFGSLIYMVFNFPKKRGFYGVLCMFAERLAIILKNFAQQALIRNIIVFAPVPSELHARENIQNCFLEQSCVNVAG